MRSRSAVSAPCQRYQRPCSGGAVSAALFTPNNQSVVSASADQTIRLWNPTNGQQAAAFGFGQPVTFTATLTQTNHIRVDAHGVARIDGTRFKVSDIALDRIAYGWSANFQIYAQPIR